MQAPATSTSPEDFLGNIQECLQKLLQAESGILKQLLITENPLLEADTTGKDSIKAAYLDESQLPPSSPTDNESLPNLVAQFMTSAETATADLHCKVDAVGPTIPFNANLFYDRLFYENLDAMTRICEAGDL